MEAYAFLNISRRGMDLDRAEGRGGRNLAESRERKLRLIYNIYLIYINIIY